MSKHAAKSQQNFIIRIAIILCLATLVGVIAGFTYNRQWRADLAPVINSQMEPSLFVVEKGWSLTRIASEMEKAGLIRNARSFVTYGKREKTVDKLQAGNYLLSPAMSVPELMQELVLGKVITKTFTIPEGFHLRQIAKTFVEAGIATEEDFWQAVANGQFDYEFLTNIPHDEKRLEGYLFPDTYTIPEGMKVEAILNLMLKRFTAIYASLPENKSGLSQRDFVTLASIVENEAKLDEERALVASVFLNRLKDNWKLESCATIQYHYDEKKARLLYADLELDSPYNTYSNTGLPPGPISSPGKASLEAVAQAVDSDYYFFVAKEDGSGGHVFSHSLSEHNQAKWLIRN
jgi:UPF0755 protein